jgi:DNA-binding transcriptional ArsR family regulator
MRKTVRVEDLNHFFGRLGKAPATSVSSVSFASSDHLARVLTPGRRAILQTIKSRTMSVSELAAELGRDIRAVSRDLDKLEELEMLVNYHESNPGHGRRRMVKSEFTAYEFIGDSEELLKRKAWLETELGIVNRQLQEASRSIELTA